MEKIKAIDLFAGIGGIRLGFEQAFGDGIDTVFVSEIDKHARNTYRANFSSPDEIHGDITVIDAQAVPEFDICLAGFPCQAFSQAGRKGGFLDTRGTLFHEVVRICEYHRPKVIFCENVRGLLYHDEGRTLKTILDAFKNIGYSVTFNVISSELFGVPQHRSRIYIAAFRDDVEASAFRFPFLTETGTSVRDILEENPVSAKYYISQTYLDGLKAHKARNAAKGNGYGYRILDPDGCANTLMCGGMGRERNLVVDERPIDRTTVSYEINDENVRKLTPREWARLQGFPDSFVIPVSDTQAYKQFGNSVTVPVVKNIALEIKKLL